ncbi:MAG: hypothetical protein ABMB14_05060 [Myxococcota bacterium]
MRNLLMTAFLFGGLSACNLPSPFANGGSNQARSAGDGDGETNDDEQGGVDCVDGIDAATGAECDGGPSANQDDGEEDDDVECEDGVDASGQPCQDDDTGAEG